MHPIEPEELMAYLDGELMPQRAAEAAQHLARCEECQTVAAEMQSVTRRLLEWQVEEAGALALPATAPMRLPEAGRPKWKRGMPWMAGAAAAVVVLAVFVAPTGRRGAALETFIAPNREAAAILEKKEGASFMIAPPAAAQIRTGPGNSAIQDILLVRTAQITLTTPEFSKTRASLEDILKRHGGHIGNLTIGSPADSGQTLQAALRVPTPQLDAVMAEIRKLGRVETEQQGGEEVTQQMVDLNAHLANSRNTEQRLAEILRRSTGKIADVLAVEKEIDRVRGEIERMEAERKNLGDRITFATLDVRVSEEYQAHLAVAAPSAFGRLRNAAVEGYRNVADSLTTLALFLLSYGPALLVWAALLFFPARSAWRRLRRSAEPTAK